MKRQHPMPFGPQRLADGRTSFRLWGPSARQVELMLDGQALPMAARPDGWHEATAAAAPGARYAFRIDGGLVVPDPASRHNPDDVHAASMFTDPLAFDWPDAGWAGRPWHEAAIYEMHVGCFTPEGTFAAAIDSLDALAALGITAIELMPVADFPGRRGWGYDGVLLFAPEARYGPPDDLKRLVAAAHARGLMVLLDVVYNHFGPDGNYLHAYARPFFNEQVHTPWGAAINFDGDGSRTVRDFFIHNALYWLEEFHFDGLRVDAVHAMHDGSALHFADELAQAVQAGPGRGRHVHVVLENVANEAARLRRGTDGRPLLATAQWNDDLHHALHVLATGETDGYYLDYAARPLPMFGRSLAEGFAYQGEPSPFRGGQPHGSVPKELPPFAFINAAQTHDQIGNRAFGERINTLAAAAGREDALRALLACVLLSPAPPMLFMGEEYAASTPFLFFCDFSGDLARAVTEGRRREFARFAVFADPAVRERIPDPNAEASFRRSTLIWPERTQGAHGDRLAFTTQLLARRQALWPWLPQADCGHFAVRGTGGAGLLQVLWPLDKNGTLHLLANLQDAPAETTLPAGAVVFDSHPPAAAGEAMRPPWSVRVSLVAA